MPPHMRAIWWHWGETWQRAALIAWAAFASFPAAALDPTRPIAEFVHDSWGVDSGLPQSTISGDIAQTPDGYLWFGTHEGLARFNGHQFRVFDSDTAPGMPSNGIMELYVRRNGELLVGLRDGGLLRVHGERVESLPLPAIDAGILALAEEADGSLWAGTRGAGLVQLPAQGEPRVLTHVDGLADDVVAAVLRAPDGELWIGTRRGLQRLQRGSAGPRVVAADGLPPVSVSDLLVDRAGRLWLGSLDAGLWVREASGWRQYGPSDGLASLTAGRIREDPDGALWIGTVAGLQRFAQGRFDPPLGADQGLSSDVVRALQVDVEGSVWVGTDGGIDRFRDGIIHALRPGRGPGEGAVRSVATDRAGRLWVGTTNGLFVLQDGHERRYDGDDGLSSESVLAILENADGRLWVSTQDGGVHTLEGERFVDHSAELQSAAGMPRGIHRVLMRAQGALLLGSQFGVLRIPDEGPAEFYGEAQGLLREQVLALFEDSQRRVWVGSRFGLMRLRPAAPGAARHYEAETLAPAFAFAAPVLGMAQYAPDSLLLATGRGLALATGDEVRMLRGPTRTLFNLLDDGLGHWWACSNEGLHRFDAEVLATALRQPEMTLSGSLLERGDGMPSRQCNGGSEPSALRLADGRLAFATTGGVAMVDPRRTLAANPRPPPVHIESIALDFQPQPLPDSGVVLQVAPGRKRIDIDYVGLSLLDPGAARYRYRLEGYDEDWIDAGHQRHAVLANLAPGDYLFRVLASNNSGVWNSEGATLALHVQAHWSQTAWFRVGLLLAALLLIALGMRLRLAALARHARELSAQVRARTADLATERDRLAQADRDKDELLSRLAEQAAKFESLSRLDGLTGLSNRREFDHALAAACASGAPVCLALGDVDHFKQINDRHSHLVGDDVLRNLATILARHCAPGESVARFGGEELALVLPGADLATARARAEAIRLAIARHPWSALHPRLKVSMSFGIARAAPGGDAAQLIADADRQLYKAKASGRNRVCG